jgi:hypothetical protein
MELVMSIVKMDNGASRATFRYNGGEEQAVVGNTHAQALDLAFAIIRKKINTP